jgi:hypothetical protein
MLTPFGRGVGEFSTGGFQRGGEVRAGTGDQPQTMPVMIADEEAMINLLGEGKNAMLDFLRENKDQFLGDEFARTR